MMDDEGAEPGATAALDQFEAEATALLATNGLALVDSTSLEPTWLADHTANELWDLLLGAGVAAGRDRRVLTLVALELPGGVTAGALGVAEKSRDDDPPA